MPVAEVPDLWAVLDDSARLLRGNLGDYSRTTTGWRQPGQQFWVYGRAGKACRRCRTAVRQCEQGDDPATERITYYCPSCQAVAPD